MASPSSSLAWRVPWTEAPCGLQSVGSQRWARLSTHAQSTFLHVHVAGRLEPRRLLTELASLAFFLACLPAFSGSDHGLSPQRSVLFCLICCCRVTKHLQASGLSSTCSFLGDHALVPGRLASLRPAFLPRSWPSGPSILLFRSFTEALLSSSSF